MNFILRSAIVLATALSCGAARAAAGDPPAQSIDLDAAKPKVQTPASTATPAATAGTIGSGFGMTQKSATTTPGAAATPIGGSAIGIKPGMGVIGSGLPGAKPAQPSTDTSSADSNDVVVKLPSNARK